MENKEFKCKHTSREGLYILVIIAMLASCEAESGINKIEKKINKLEKKIELIINQNNTNTKDVTNDFPPLSRQP